MSRTINKGWIQKSLKSLICSDKKFNCTPKVCVVVDVDRINKMITLSDTNFKIKAFLTDSCVENFERDHSDICSLKYCIIKIENYHYSTILQCCAGDKFPSALTGLNFTFETLPTVTSQFCIQLLELSYLSNDYQSQQTPSNDINRNAEIINGSLILKNYSGVIDKLVNSQFPSEAYLPNAQGKFYLGNAFSNSNPLIIDYCHTDGNLVRNSKITQKKENKKKTLKHDGQKPETINEFVFKFQQPMQSNVLITGNLSAADVSKSLTCREDIENFISTLSHNDQNDTYVGDSATDIMAGEGLLHTQLPCFESDDSQCGNSNNNNNNSGSTYLKNNTHHMSDNSESSQTIRQRLYTSIQQKIESNGPLSQTQISGDHQTESRNNIAITRQSNFKLLTTDGCVDSFNKSSPKKRVLNEVYEDQILNLSEFNHSDYPIIKKDDHCRNIYIHKDCPVYYNGCERHIHSNCKCYLCLFSFI